MKEKILNCVFFKGSGSFLKESKDDSFFRTELIWSQKTGNQQEAFMFSATTLDFYTRTS
jgi:hypothetical protein